MRREDILYHCTKMTGQGVALYKQTFIADHVPIREIIHTCSHTNINYFTDIRSMSLNCFVCFKNISQYIYKF